MTDPLYTTPTPPMPIPPGGTAPPSNFARATTHSGTDEDAKARAGAAADAVKGAGSDVASTAADKAKEVAAETKQQARDLIGEARDTMSQQAGQQRQNVVNNLRTLGDEFSSMSDATDHNGVGVNLVSRAGEHAHRIADWIDNRDPNQLVDEVRTFARRRPGAFLAGALVVGLAAGRLTRGVVDTHRDDSSPTGDASSSGSQAQAADLADLADHSGYGVTPAYVTGAPTAEPTVDPTTAYLPAEPALPPVGGLASEPTTNFPRQGGI